MTDPSLPPARSVAEHRAAAPETVGVAILTMSDTRTKETDTSGTLIRELLNLTGHTIVEYRIVPDEPARIRETLAEWTANPAIQAILTNGGTGIAQRDTTYDVVAGLLEKRLDGFGELFRMLSYQEIGPAAMLSRAVAGVYKGRLVITMPGSRNAVQLAMTKLIVPELAHLVFEVTK
jgi:molybdenum cofactor biosynthesis protein B